MSRQPRKLSATDIYHVTLRSINQQILFEENADFYNFLKFLRISRNRSDFELYAYCLMDNHIHMLIKIQDEPLSRIIERITNMFVPWYNHKYGRTGHLFQGRFHSSPVETEHHLFNSCRYILQNPVRSGIVHTCSDYKWSSMRAYLGSDDGLTDTEMLRSQFDSQQELISFLNATAKREETGLPTVREHISDRDALRIMEKLTGCATPVDFLKLNRDKRNKFIVCLRKKHLPVRQISRVTGLSTRTIFRICK